MGPGEIGALIPLFGIACGMLAIWTNHQRKMAQIRASSGSADNMAAAEHIRELEDRVRVLERIVTDKGTDVAAQIEALRDAPRIEARITERAQ